MTIEKKYFSALIMFIRYKAIQVRSVYSDIRDIWGKFGESSKFRSIMYFVYNEHNIGNMGIKR